MVDDDPIVIPLGNNLICWISREDEELASMPWQARKGGRDKTYFYSVNRVHIGKNQKIETFMHNLVWERMMGEPVPEGYLVDHRNRDKLDNRRSNLRLADRTQNEANKAKRKGKTSSKYKGVNFNKGLKKPWRVIITKNKKRYDFGSYHTEAEAGRVYNEEAKKLFGEFAYLNDIPEDE